MILLIICNLRLIFVRYKIKFEKSTKQERLKQIVYLFQSPNIDKTRPSQSLKSMLHNWNGLDH